MNAAPSLARHFARTGVDPLTAAFSTEPATGRPARASSAAGSSSAGSAGVSPVPAPAGDASSGTEKVAALRAAMPAHALRVFETWQAAPENSSARADIENTLPPHALQALKTLAAAVRQTRPVAAAPEAPAPGARPASSWSDIVADAASRPPLAAPGSPRLASASRPLALYAHFPFCAARCAFCPFYRYSDPADWRPYQEALLRDIDLAAAPFASAPAPAAVYFGGGTPSDLPGDALVVLLKQIHRLFPVHADTEITVEGRPSTFTPEKIAALRAAGANRFSLGVQTFDGRVRQAMGRRLGDDALLPRLREIARAAAGAPIIIDLIYGLPGQTDESWERDLDHVLAEEAVAGLDLYRLKVFPGSPLARLAAEGRAAPADDAVMGRRFARGVARLEAAGFRRLSRWHWARDARERSVYNRLAKGAGDIIPLGCGAGGRWRGVDFMTTPALPAWMENIAAGRRVCAGRGAAAAPWHEPLSAQIEACRLAPRAWTDASLPGLFAADTLLEQWLASGLIKRDGDEWPLTLAGQYWSDRLLHSLQTVLAA